MGSVREAVEDFELSPEAKTQLIEDLYNLFYEVGFEVEFDESTGKVLRVRLKADKYGQKEVFTK